MRAEEKELEGPDLEREQAREDLREAASLEEALPELTIEVTDVELESRSRLLDALRLILAGEQVNLTLLYLPQRETHALEALQAATTGTDSMGEFVFAEDRRALLEQALAVLQQNLTYGDPAQLAELQSKFDSMAQRVGELREELSSLEDAQETVDEFHSAAKEQAAAAAGDKDDADKPEPDPGLVDFVESSLVHGPEKQETPKLPSTLSGPERPEPPTAPSTLTGPGGPDITPRPKSTLSDEPVRVPTTPTATHDPAPQLRKVAPPTPPEPPKKGKP